MNNNQLGIISKSGDAYQAEGQYFNCRPNSGEMNNQFLLKKTFFFTMYFSERSIQVPLVIYSQDKRKKIWKIKLLDATQLAPNVVSTYK